MEVLAPAGNLQKLKYAVLYGADAVYAAGKAFGLRAKAGNFSNEELEEAVSFCHQRQCKLYITLNIYAHNEHFRELPEYVLFLKKINVDAVIVSDSGVFATIREIAPEMEVHISTQANVTSWRSAKFWYDLGASRVILARELSINEIKEIKAKVPALELEMFVHGAMCIAYSGRCLLSAFLNNRSANTGACTQVCRWNFALVEKQRPNEQFEIEEDDFGSYILNSKDLNLVTRLNEIQQAGIDSIKIEGRMKSLYYVANVVRVYKEAVRQLEKKEVLQENVSEELFKISHRIYTEAFFDGENLDTQHYESSAYIREHQFLGEVIEQKNGVVEIAMRAKFEVGDFIEFVFPNLKDDFILKVEEIFDHFENAIPFTKPNTTIKLKINQQIPKNGIIRKKI